MTEIKIITKDNRCRHTELMQRYHRARHDIFVGERGWSALERDDGLDLDQFDDEHAIYILALDGEKLVGGQRLYPTIVPHMMTEVFSHLAQRALPVGPQVMEWTRYFVVRERRTGRTDGLLMAAVQDYALQEGISTLTAVVEMWWLPRWRQVGFNARPLGLPQMVEGQPTVAVAIDISEESLATVRQVCGLRGREIIRTTQRAYPGGFYAA